MKTKVMLVFSLMLAVNLFAQTSTPPSSGTGTSGDPYLIATLDNLYWVTQNSSSWDKYFKQTADIDAATTSGWDGGAGFLPIGNTSTPFTGSYNGQGGIISSLTINRPSVSFVGMFGFVEGGEIVNLGIDADITGSGYVGAIAGCASFSSTISNCLTDGTLTGDYYTGGVVGSLEEGSTLDKSGSLSDVSGQRYVGGLVGRNLAAITDCYASGSVNGSVSDEGGLVGGNTSTPTVSNSFWDTETSTLAASAGGTGKTTTEMKTLATFTSTASSGLTTPWDFVGTPNDDAGIADWWNMDASETNFGGYPIPSWYAFTNTPSGDGSSGAPYQIATLNHLYWLSQLSTTYPAYVYVEQTADIAAYSTAYINSGQGFLPVGNPDYFVGSYNGQQHEIAGLFINRSTTDQVGFFYSLYDESIVLDLHLTELDILGNSRVGGLVGKASTANITLRRSSCSGNVEAIQDKVGLLAGIMEISGIIVEECWTEGIVTGDSEVGGLIGRCGGAASVGISMSDCYSRADVIADNTAGGLIGRLLQGVHTGVHIEHCYSTGTVTGNSDIGGLFGYEAADLSLVTLTANFWDTESSGLTDGVGSLDPDPAGITGETTSNMQSQTTYTTVGWDFSSVWEIIGTNYPRLRDNPDPTLPVTLSSFTGSLENGFPTLNWITESELENLGWNIYRCEEENGFATDNSLKLNESLIPGMGTLSTPTTYNYIDEQPAENLGFHYYWLESVSYSGELEVFGPVSIDLSESNLIPVVPVKSFINQNRPNPFNPTTTIEFGIEEGEKGTLSIYNSKGQKILSQKYEAGFHTFNWDASQQASGVYFYRLQTPSYHKTIRMLMLK
ncbi:MAG: T9SS type A sorting domain-containing protein [Candidatus Cloacimonetes bacterium]|nr:T9SS type A sorting domain-containing protein [Candidatus Cloacimonadota bacterium]MCF7869156.1 T9SS type A sorting domain-containing protein [Candidatus Cloacimonadota bacterium]MCF7884608.1 T9SS type A sorting domain-containing protein [Candidatus Cloacimonadota bacterium]